MFPPWRRRRPPILVGVLDGEASSRLLRPKKVQHGGWVAEWLARQSSNPRLCGLAGSNRDRRSARNPPHYRGFGDSGVYTEIVVWTNCTY